MPVGIFRIGKVTSELSSVPSDIREKITVVPAIVKHRNEYNERTPAICMLVFFFAFSVKYTLQNKQIEYTIITLTFPICYTLFPTQISKYFLAPNFRQHESDSIDTKHLNKQNTCMKREFLLKKKKFCTD